MIFAINISIIEYWFFSDVEHFFPELHPLLHVSSILLLLYLKKNNTKNIDDFNLIQKKKPTAK
jgi:hypothetical protein